jgi:PAS domain S-box-containing protein
MSSPFDDYLNQFDRVLIRSVEEQLGLKQETPTRLENGLADLIKQADSISIPVFILDIDGRLVYANRVYTDIFGTLDRIGETGWLKTVHPTDLEHLQNVIDEATRKRIPYSVELRMKGLSGEARWYALLASFKLESADHLYYLGTIQDIDDFKKAMTTTNPEAQTKLDKLTARELELLDCLACGYTNQEIAAKLVISEATVKNHLASIFLKLEVKNRSQAALLAQKMKLQ